MEWIRDKRKRIFTSLAAGAVAAVLMGGVQFTKGSSLTAWWGTMYPRFCFAEQEKPAENGRGELPEVRLTFWLKEMLCK